MRIRIPYRAAILLGAAGWILTAYPRIFLLYDQIVSGEALRVARRALSSGVIDSSAIMVALSLLPVGPLLFLAALYLEASGKIGALVRRSVCAPAVTLMMVATAVISKPFVPLGGWREQALWASSLIALWAWTPLIALFAAVRDPLRYRLTAGMAGVIAVLTGSLSLIVIYESVRRSGLVRVMFSLSFALLVAASLCLVLFAIGAISEARRQRATTSLPPAIPRLPHSALPEDPPSPSPAA